MADATDEQKICASCGRRFGWRRKWAANWADVRYCSDACRKRKITAADRELEQAIMERARRGTVAAQTLGDGEPVRRAARRLAAAGDVELLQHGRVVDAAGVRGPFEIRLSRSTR